MQTETTSVQDIQNAADKLENTNPQVKATKQKTIRRKFSSSDKRKILEAYDALDAPLSRGAFLREKGLYASGIMKWRNHLSGQKSSLSQIKTDKLIAKHNQVSRENAALKKRLAQAEAIIDLQKKVSELLSTHILPVEMSEEK